IGGECEQRNIEVVNEICGILEDLYPSGQNPALGRSFYRDLISFVSDRPGHDRRYAINCDKAKAELGWRQEHTFGGALRHTVKWYLEHREWVERIRSGEYMQWIEKNYGARG
ncbi:MAG TPA: dTDP-glucose 4,6-dehydratase, partial [Dissulfurispiraceae bacterium]